MLRLSIQIFALLVLGTGLAPAEYDTVQVAIGPHDSKGTLNLYYFDSRQSTFKVIDQGRPALQSYKDLDAAMSAHRCQAGCNGGPFDQAGHPHGLVIADGKTTGSVSSGKDTSAGVLYLEGGLPRLQKTSQFLARDAAKPSQLIQSGPFLVEGGKPNTDSSNRRISRRTFVFTDGKHRWAIGYAPATTLHQLALALADPKTFKGFKVATALSLDGGLSAAIWIKRDHGPLYLKESRKVRNFIGVLPR
jgi:uncharacterized protein YigE (DUF2233 family)